MNDWLIRSRYANKDKEEVYKYCITGLSVAIKKGEVISYKQHISSKIPHCCPVCNGAGKVQRPPYVAGDQCSWISSGGELYPCPPCKGTGIIWEKLS